MNKENTTAQPVQPAPPTTIEQVMALPHGEAKSYAGGNLLAISNLPVEGGQMTSKKLFMEGTKLVYEFYRVNAKNVKFYVIF